MLIDSYSYNKREVFVDSDNDCIYQKKAKNISDYRKQRTTISSSELTDVLDEFLNTKNSEDMKRFLEKYGLLYEVVNLEEKTSLMNEFPKKKSYVAVGRISEYIKIKKELDTLRNNISYTKALFKYLHGDMSEGTIYLVEQFWGEDILLGDTRQASDIETYAEDMLNVLNDMIGTINIIVVSDSLGILSQTFEYPSLLSVLYAKLAEELTGDKGPLRCKKCKKWIRFRENKVYCEQCSNAGRKEAYNEKADKKKDAVHQRVRGHFRELCSGKVSREGYYKHLLNLDVYVPDSEEWLSNEYKCLKDWFKQWKEDARDIKRSSHNYYKDMDKLCRKVCRCEKCQSGIATLQKNKYESKHEKKQGSPE